MQQVFENRIPTLKIVFLIGSVLTYFMIHRRFREDSYLSKQQNVTIDADANFKSAEYVKKIKPVEPPTKRRKMVTVEKMYSDGYTDIFNPNFLKYLMKYWIHKPSTEKLNLESPTKKHYSQYGQSIIMDDILRKNPGKGFFIECGAWDGEILSNSLYFEKVLNWTGLLVEPNKNSFNKLKTKHRHSYSINSCLSPVNATKKFNFISNAEAAGGLIETMDKSHMDSFKIEKEAKNMELVQCFPLASILKAIDVNHINYFSLDVEGAELNILRTIPFNEIKIDTFSIEYAVDGSQKKTWEKIEALEKFFKSLDLYLEPKIVEPIDLIFVRKDFMTQQELDSIFYSPFQFISSIRLAIKRYFRL